VSLSHREISTSTKLGNAMSKYAQKSCSSSAASAVTSTKRRTRITGCRSSAPPSVRAALRYCDRARALLAALRFATGATNERSFNSFSLCK
jgi:hypothetical protein